MDAAPVKSSLTKYRTKISYLFFKDQFLDLNNSFKRPKWKGVHVYGTDGFELAVPRTKQILKAGYRGRRVKTESGDKGETYYPHMYTVQTYDLLSKTTKAISVLIDNHEPMGALENLKHLEQRSLTLYDRGFCTNKKLMKAHFEYKNYFFIRFKSGGSIPVAVKEFIHSNKKRDSFLYEGDPKQRIYLYKIKNKKQNAEHIYGTNFRGISLPEAEALYRMRWEVENSFRDQVNTLPIEQWHSKTENGLLQELYVRLWIINFARIEQFKAEKSAENPLNPKYRRSNFKLILDFIIKSWDDFFARKRKYLQKIKVIIRVSAEVRTRYSRMASRKLRYQHKNYSAANIVFDKKEIIMS